MYQAGAASGEKKTLWFGDLGKELRQYSRYLIIVPYHPGTFTSGVLGWADGAGSLSSNASCQSWAVDVFGPAAWSLQTKPGYPGCAVGL